VVAKAKRPKQKIWGPASEEQRLVLTAQEDVILVGGGAGGK
jgi:hypothetical protein